MTEPEIFLQKIKDSIKLISSKTDNEKQDVVDIINSIISDFQKLEDNSFRHILNLKSRPIMLDLLNKEIEWIMTDQSHITDNYLETQLTLSMVAIPFEPK
jgi:hypothetical protein